MKKIDLKKKLKPLYGTTRTQGFVIVDVAPMNFLMVDGQGNPNTSQAFADAVEALYSMSYPLKFRVKKSPLALDYGVMPLEALWWTDDMADFSPSNKDIWKWTVMIMQPEWITAEMVEEVRNVTANKKDLPALPRLRFESFDEGQAAQCLYIGPYADEAPTIQALHAFIEENGFARRGKHHEIYLSDMRRTDPARLKTILRQPLADTS
ncbi:MAG: GyrI-like domain-containing protein [Pseudomonadota bacterium]